MKNNILRYICGTDNYSLDYKKNDNFILIEYMYVDYGESLDDQILMTSYIFFLKSRPILWTKKK